MHLFLRIPFALSAPLTTAQVGTPCPLACRSRAITVVIGSRQTWKKHHLFHGSQDLQHLSLMSLVSPQHLARSGDPPGSGGAPQTPMYISNPDFVFAAMYQEPRFAAVSASFRGSRRSRRPVGTGDVPLSDEARLMAQFYGPPRTGNHPHAPQTVLHWRVLTCRTSTSSHSGGRASHSRPKEGAGLWLTCKFPRKITLVYLGYVVAFASTRTSPRSQASPNRNVSGHDAEVSLLCARGRACACVCAISSGVRITFSVLYAFRRGVLVHVL